jgi:hypothetical protein
MALQPIEIPKRFQVLRDKCIGIPFAIAAKDIAMQHKPI